MVAISRAALVDAAMNLNSKEGLNLDPPIDVSLSVGEIRAAIVEAGALLSAEYGDADKISHETAVVVNMLRDDIIAAVPRLRERDIDTIGIDVVLDDVRGQLDAIAVKVASQAEKAGEEASGTEVEVAETPANGELESWGMLSTAESSNIGDESILGMENAVAHARGQKRAARETVVEQVTPPPAPEKKVRTRKREAPKSSQLGRFRPVRRVGHFAKILREYLSSNGPRMLGQVATSVGMTSDKALAALKKARRANGIDYEVTDYGLLTIILPEGVDAVSVWQGNLKDARPHEKPQKKAVAPKVQRQRVASHTVYLKPGGVSAMFEAARNGEMPAHIVITSPTNLNNQKHFDKLKELADGGDWDGVRSYEAKGSNYYAEMIRRYRDLLVTAHEAQQGRGAVAAQ